MRVLTSLTLAAAVGGCATSSSAVGGPDPADLTVESLAFLEGAWEGTLTYLDYGDDETQVTLPMRADFERSDDSFRFAYIFTEPNGSEVRDGGLIVLVGEDKLRMGSEVLDIERVLRDSEGHVRDIEMTQRGSDNNRPSMFFHSMRLRGDTLTIAKDVQIDGADSRFTRNEYSFVRR